MVGKARIRLDWEKKKRRCFFFDTRVRLVSGGEMK